GLDGAADRAQALVGGPDRARQDGAGALRALAVGEGDGEGDREVGHAVAEVVADLVTGHGDRERVRFAVPAGGGVDVGRGAAADRGEQELDGGEGGVRAVAGGGAEVDGPAPGVGRGETAG